MLYSMFHTIVPPLAKWMYRLNVVGTENIPEKGKMILCSNHRSMMDPILLGVSMKRKIRYMAKEELFLNHGKVVGKFLRSLGAFPVKRGSSDTEAIKQAIDILEQGGMLGIFPQGGIVAYGVPFQPKSGVAMIAYHAKSPVMPVSIYTDGDVKRFKQVTIRFGKPIAYEEFGFTDGNRKEIKHVSHMIAEQVNALLEAK